MSTLVHVLANQKGGVGKTTLAMNLAAVTYEALTPRTETPERSPVLVASTDPQASSVWWSDRVKNLPFDYVQVTDTQQLAALRSSGYAHVFVDTPGSLDDEDILQAVLLECDDVLVPMPPEPLAFDPTSRTIDEVIVPNGIPYMVVVNNWDPRDGEKDLAETAEFIRAKGWPMCNNVVRRYKVHTKASAEGTVCTQYAKNRVGIEAKLDFFQLALELGYGGAVPAAVN